MAMSGEAASGGDTNAATFTQPRRVRTELRELSPGSGQYGYLPIEDELPIVRVKQPDGSIRDIRPARLTEGTHHGELSEEMFGSEQMGFDTQETPIVHDHNPDA